ncbi:MAG: hypothetical protein HY978_03690 [Candidatus Liptonbacteria bacterium]|nr:hypothetical protein [Candidatus Liptonbacteria bacterium]
MDIIAEIKKLDLPAGKYVVVGSGPMAVRGLKDAHDIDLVIAPEVFEHYRAAGWQVLPWTYANHPGQDQVFLRQGILELYLDVNCGDFCPTLEELVRRADMISGVAFASLPDTISFKRAYGREKHLRDVAVIEEYLKLK